MTVNYTIEFFSYWHVGSGLSSGTYADSVVKKTADGFPYIPGKTLKGLLREAAEHIHAFDENLVTAEFIADVFGMEPTSKDTITDNLKVSSCFFSNAFLSDYIRDNTEAKHRQYFFDIIASTRINERGTAETGTLRQIEVTVPLILHAVIENFPDSPSGYKKQIEYCFKWVKRLGLGRNRGLGRCKISN